MYYGTTTGRLQTCGFHERVDAVAGTSAENPWTELRLSGGPYVPEQDRCAVQEFNKETEDEDKKIHLELWPEPYLGDPDAPVVLLNANPGYDELDLLAHKKPAFAQKARQNLLHGLNKTDYPFYLLDPDLTFAPGFWWWRKTLKDLIDHDKSKPIEERLKIVAKRVFCVEYFPYHSKNYGWPDGKKYKLKSQQYSVDLVHDAIKRKALILILRKKKRWLAAVEGLENYPHCYTATAARNAQVTNNNFHDGFREAQKKIWR